MPLTVRDLPAAVADLQNSRTQQSGRLNRIWRHLNDRVTGRQAGVYVPARVTREFRMLVEQARFNVLELVVTTVAQNLFVEGFMQAVDQADPDARVRNADVWEAVWQPNRMDARQSGVFRAAVTYGTSYVTVLPGLLEGTPLTDPEDVPIITPYSPRKLTALYADHVNGEWPDVAMVALYMAHKAGEDVEVVEVYDDAFVWTLELRNERAPTILNLEEHGLGVTPVVRFRNRFELEGSYGKVEPLIPLQQQLNQTTFSLLMAQQYGAFRQRYVTGMEIQEDEHGRPKQPFNVAVDTFLQGESPDTRFGEFSQTDLSGYLSSRDKQLLHIASVAQLPPHNLVSGSGISNISAEALVALEAAHRQDIDEHQHSLGEGVEQTLRLAGLAMGDVDVWLDRSAQVRWADTTPRSLAQQVDALIKLRAGLEVPQRALWEMVPGVTEQDIRRWEALADQGDLLGNINQAIDAAIGSLDAQPAGQPADPAASL